MSIKYFIGDLCYVLDDNAWSEVCSMCTFDNETWEYTLSDGRKFYLFNTAYGDGEYFDQFGGRYPVDSGTLGAIPMSDIHECRYNPEEMGCTHDFDSPLEECECSYEDGEITFGTVTIDTN